MSTSPYAVALFKLLKKFNTLVPRTTRPKTVKPPFWLSRLALLLARLKNHWEVAEFGSPPTLAIAMVPKVLVRRRPTLNSFVIGPNVGTKYTPLGLNRLVLAGSATANPPPCTMKPGMQRCRNIF